MTDWLFNQRREAQFAVYDQPLDHRYRDMVDVKRYGNEPCNGDWTNWAVTSGFTLLVFYYNAHHEWAFAHHGYSEHDMLLTGSGERVRGGHDHIDFRDDPKGEWELIQEVMRMFRDDPSILCNISPK